MAVEHYETFCSAFVAYHPAVCAIRECGSANPSIINARDGLKLIGRDFLHEDADAQFWLGAGYEQGLFGKSDFQEAMKWLQRAAKHSNPDAQITLGQMCEDGEGVPKNYVLAAQWYRKAAEHVPDLGGAGQGRNHLGLLYLQGLGVPKDYLQAYMWFSLAGVESKVAAAQEAMKSGTNSQGSATSGEMEEATSRPAIK